MQSDRSKIYANAGHKIYFAGGIEGFESSHQTFTHWSHSVILAIDWLTANSSSTGHSNTIIFFYGCFQPEKTILEIFFSQKGTLNGCQMIQHASSSQYSHKSTFESLKLDQIFRDSCQRDHVSQILPSNWILLQQRTKSSGDVIDEILCHFQADSSCSLLELRFCIGYVMHSTNWPRASLINNLTKWFFPI